MSDWMFENLGWVIILFVIGVVALIVALYAVIDPPSCYSRYSDWQPSWDFWGGCRIVYKGKLTPVDMISNINLEN